VKLHNVLLNSKIPFNLLETNSAENVIYCSSFSDYLFNIGIFKTKTKEIIVEYTTENLEKYAKLDVTLEDKTHFRNVLFKIIIDENIETPYSTINLSLLKDGVKIATPAPEKIAVIEEKNNIKNPVIKQQPEIIPPVYTEMVNEALRLEKQLAKEKKELEKEKIILEKQNIVKERLAEYKQELLEEYFNATKKQGEVSKAKLVENFNDLETDLRERIYNTFEEYGIEFEAKDKAYREEQLNTLLEKITKESNENRINLEVQSKNLEITYNERLKNKTEQLVEVLEKNYDKTEQLAKVLEKNYNDKLIVELEKYKAGLFNDFVVLTNIEAGKIAPEFNKQIKQINEKVKKLIDDKNKESKDSKKFNDEQQKYIADVARYWARRILDLGSGGGSVAVQYADGGIMNGTLNVNGHILSGGKDISSFFDLGPSNINTVVSGNSGNWNSTHTTVNTYSAAWSTGIQTLAFNNSNFNLSIVPGNTVNLGILKDDLTEVIGTSGSWNSTYSVTRSNSSNWSYAYQQVIDLSSKVSYLSSQIDKNVYENIASNKLTIAEFAVNPHPTVYKGYTVALTANKRVYIFAGYDDSNPEHYLEINTNPHSPIYVESIVNQNSVIIDAFELSEFKSAKYTLQVETNFNNEIYYSELNVVGTVAPSQSVVTEYGQLGTSELISGYTTTVVGGMLYLTATFTTTLTNPIQRYSIKGLRTNFYKI